MIIYIGIHVAFLVILIYMYHTTHDQILLWLGGLLIVWRLVVAPLLAYAIQLAVKMISSGWFFFPLSFLRTWGISTKTMVAALAYLPNGIELVLAVAFLVMLFRDRPKGSQRS